MPFHGAVSMQVPDTPREKTLRSEDFSDVPKAVHVRISPDERIKKQDRKSKPNGLILIIVFPKFWPLDAGILKIRPQIRNLHKKSSPEPDS